MNRTGKIAVTVCSLLGLSALVALDAKFGGLRFVNSRANEAVDFAASELPLVCLGCLGFLPRGRTQLLSFVVLVPVAAFCLLGGVGDLVGEALYPATFTRQSSLRLGYSQVVTYFSDDRDMNGGDFYVQQEVKLLPGLLWIKPVSKAECLRDVKITVLDRHHVQCDYVADTADSLDPNPAAKRDVAWMF